MPIRPMPRITYIGDDGSSITTDAEIGSTVMETAVASDVPGILATCGGSCACATCHVYIAAAWWENLSQRSEDEEDMLDTAHNIRATSRLSCQIKVTPELDGLVVHTPARQI